MCFKIPKWQTIFIPNNYWYGIFINLILNKHIVCNFSIYGLTLGKSILPMCIFQLCSDICLNLMHHIDRYFSPEEQKSYHSIFLKFYSEKPTDLVIEFHRTKINYMDKNISNILFVHKIFLIIKFFK